MSSKKIKKKIINGHHSETYECIRTAQHDRGHIRLSSTCSDHISLKLLARHSVCTNNKTHCYEFSGILRLECNVNVIIMIVDVRFTEGVFHLFDAYPYQSQQFHCYACSSKHSVELITLHKRSYVPEQRRSTCV